MPMSMIKTPNLLLINYLRNITKNIISRKIRLMKRKRTLMTPKTAIKTLIIQKMINWIPKIKNKSQLKFLVKTL
jgi:hypothetical protein